jgi:site-specific DNA recombinase
MSEDKRLQCAIYTRKSTSENLEMAFNTLEAQREAAELYIRSQGWLLRPDRYDDGGFTGANMERPALQRLLQDIEDGKVECVVVYKVDRLSRSLLDFARLIEVFDRKGVTFVSTTQQFNTAQSLGRLVLNILLSFAQFEREMISERTRDKMSAARRRGKWTGGQPVLGYRVDHEHCRLEIVPEEAEQVRAIFQLYRCLHSVQQVAKKLRSLNWTTKVFTTEDGRSSGGKPWDPTSVHRLLKNALYTGKVTYQGKSYDGEHPSIIDTKTFEQVQALLAGKSRGRGPHRGRNPEYLLTGLLSCPGCGKPLTTTSGRGGKGSHKDYRYYVCRTRQSQGHEVCTGVRVPAAEIEQAVLGRLREICAEPETRADVATRMRAGHSLVSAELTAQRALVQREIDALTAEGRKLVAAIGEMQGTGGPLVLARLSEIEADIARQQSKLDDVDRRMHGLAEATEHASTAVGLLESFDDVWNAMVPEERVDVVHLLVNSVRVDPAAGKLELHLHDLAHPFPPVSDLAQQMEVPS